MNDFDTGFAAAKADVSEGWFAPSDWSPETLRANIMINVGGSVTPEWVAGYIAGAFAS